MEELKARYKSCKLCHNCLNQVKVFGQGGLSAEIAVVGEGPGKDEITKEEPFIGAAGQLLNLILSGINLKRDDLFLTNAILCRTDEKNRVPTKEEYVNCRKRLFEEINIVKPKFMLLLGNTALRSVMGSDSYKMSESHGKWFTLLSEPCFFYFATYHPSWILHSATEGEERFRKKVVWEDMKRFRDDMKFLREIYEKPGETIDEECSLSNVQRTKETSPFL